MVKGIEILKIKGASVHIATDGEFCTLGVANGTDFEFKPISKEVYDMLLKLKDIKGMGFNR